ncbi:hypothetical protein A5791_01620 [Mycobacterium sp. 852002-51163_SCH5372311]|uniref:DUF4226 domain-containing protein n=1 Tax=Mycobacterium sp. 852002-51163_SCH5372311 TaxID=1834097 RepID=UPI0008014013|nr:DUF4226 domain-containing protein [Mycobacterium sp. 852002-51163_SCH5372311]OBF86169.1 hypothetical protein A5791_01620 [Mycobacterium sp. 852002-51163_SCH5372311]
MSTWGDLVAALARVRAATGDPEAWKTGLTTDEVKAVVIPFTSPEQLEAILGKVRRQHPELFNVGTGAPAAGPPADRPDSDAAEAIARAEAALAHQNSASSQLDLQVVSAILNAHLKTVDGRAALTKLQQEIEAALRGRSDLDTPAGARDFQRFLIGKLRDIRSVVADASLDDTSKSALMAAWTSLYNASTAGSSGAGEGRPPTTAPTPTGGLTDEGSEPYLDALLADDPGLPDADSPPSGVATAPPAPGIPMSSAIPGIPNLGGAATPGGAVPTAMPGLGLPGGLPLAGASRGSGIDPELRELDDDRNAPSKPTDRDGPGDLHDNPHDKDGEHKDASSADPEAAGPTSVTLPDGETVTAASPQLAAAIKAAAAGVPIPEAFRQQGITIPPPGTPVAQPIEPSQVTPGDVGMFTDRHALALGHSKAIMDGQIQHISTVSGPSFLGWEHPPEPATQAPGTAPAQTEPPTPTRPAATPVGLARAQ